MQEFHNYINGQIVKSDSTETTPIFMPSTGEQTGVVYTSGVSDVNKAVAVGKIPHLDRMVYMGQRAYIFIRNLKS